MGNKLTHPHQVEKYNQCLHHYLEYAASYDLIRVQGRIRVHCNDRYELAIPLALEV